MGEYAEMMLDGTCCEGCGEYLGDGGGFPAYCSAACAKSRGADFPVARSPARSPIHKAKCPECGKKVKRAGLKDHLRDMHSAENFGGKQP